LIWDVVGSSAALYDTGPTPRFGLSFPPGLPGLSALHIGRPLTFTSFAPLRRFRVDRFDGPFALNRASNLGESFAELHMPGRAYIPAFNMGSSIGLPSVVSGSIVRGNMSLKFPRFRYQGETF
jgi:hypothetical protein